MLRVLVLAAVLAAMVASDALACSCGGGDGTVGSGSSAPLAGADIAFLGRVVAKRTYKRSYLYTLAVERAYKGDPGSRVRVRSSRSSSPSFPSCGLGADLGDRLALALRGKGPVFTAGICDEFDPSVLGPIAYPEPAGRGRLAALVGAPFGDAGLAGLDRAGRLLAYGFGTEGPQLSVCPGGRFALQAGDAVHTVRLRDLRRVRSVPLPGDDATALRCFEPSGRSAAVATYGPGSSTTKLVRVSGAATRSFGAVRHGAVALGRRAAFTVHYASGRWQLFRRSYGGSVRRIASGRGWANDLAVSPDERHAALTVIDRRAYEFLRVTVVDLRSATVRSVSVPGNAALPTWLGRRRLGLAAGPILRVPDLRPVGRLVPFQPRRLRVRGSELWTLGSRGGLRRGLVGGPLDLLETVPHLSPQDLAVLPRPLTLRGAPRSAPVPAQSAASSQARMSSPCSSRRGGARRTGGR